MIDRYLLKMFGERRIWRRLLKERLTEPLHLNLFAVFVAAFGTFRAKVAFDLIVRQQYAFGLLKAADHARQIGVSRLTAIEFGVASGAGMLNICAIAEQVQRVTGVEFEVVGFDSGEGLPPPRDFRDHPELYSAGDYPMTDRGALMSRLPGYAKIYFGNVAERVEAFLAEQKSTIGFVAFDLDYYWSTAAALKIFEAPADCYLPKVVCYFDDVGFDWHNAYAGELLAINEFNTAHEWRKITPYNFLGKERIFTRAKWIERMYLGHIFDHSFRSPHSQKVQQARVLSNPYLGG